MQCPGSGPCVPALLFHWANFSLFFKTRPQSNPNHDTTRKPPLIFLRLGKMSPSGLPVAPGCSLGGSCVWQVPNVPAALGPGPGPSRCWKACSEQTVTCMDLLPTVHRELTHFRCWLGQNVTQDPAVVAQMPEPSPGGGVSCRYVRASPTASPAEPPKLLPCLAELLSEPL